MQVKTSTYYAFVIADNFMLKSCNCYYADQKEPVIYTTQLGMAQFSLFHGLIFLLCKYGSFLVVLSCFFTTHHVIPLCDLMCKRDASLE